MEFEGTLFSEDPIWKLEHSPMHRLNAMHDCSSKTHLFRIFESESSCGERRVVEVAASFAPAIQQYSTSSNMI